MKKTKLPRDPNQRAKSIVDIATGTIEIKPDNKNLVAVNFGREGGLIRTKKLSAEKRSEIARNAAQIRWKGKS